MLHPSARALSVLSSLMALSLTLSACQPDAKDAKQTGNNQDAMSVAKVDKTHADPASAASGAVNPKDAAQIAAANGADGTAVRGKPFAAKGIYMTATTVELPRFKSMIDELKAAGGNTIVFDAKDETGTVQYRSEVPLAKKIDAFKEGPIRDLKAKVAYAHSKGIHVAGRVCCFHDPILAKKRPDLDPKDVHGGVWKELGQQSWLDPSLPENQQYIIDLATELAKSGVDEVQFDYIRFPAMGHTENARYGFDASKYQKHDIITAFLKKAYAAIHATGATVSIDVYGIMAWAQPIDIRITGQKMDEMCKYTDVICPMDYPSHFNDGFAGIAHPANAPYTFVDAALSRLNKRVAGSGVLVRPWLQGMPYKVASFTPHYITEELRAADKDKAVGYLMWNAQNRYDVAFAGMKAYGGK